MATEVIMPQLGLTMTEGLVAKWLKSAGDNVKKGEPLLEVETDKISKEIEATADGVLISIVVPDGEIVPVRASLAYIGQPGETVKHAEALIASADAAATVAAEIPAAKAKPITAGWVKASPLARRIAREQGVALSLLQGTGPDGRIVERDVRAALAVQAKTAVSPLAAKLAAEHGVNVSAIKHDGRVMSADVLAAVKPASASAVKRGRMLSGMRKVIAERLTQSWKAPHVHMTAEVDMTAALAAKKKLAAAGQKLSFTELTVLACTRALMEFPAVNSALVNGEVLQFDTVNIGVAVALDNGLMVPVIRDAQTKSLAELRAEIAALSEVARTGTVSPDAPSGGTFSVTKLGDVGLAPLTPGF